MHSSGTCNWPKPFTTPQRKSLTRDSAHVSRFFRRIRTGRQNRQTTLTLCIMPSYQKSVISRRSAGLNESSYNILKSMYMQSTIKVFATTLLAFFLSACGSSRKESKADLTDKKQRLEK